MISRRSISILAIAVACSSPPRIDAVGTEAKPPPIVLVESQPVETTLDSDLPDAHRVWLEMIDRAERSIDFAQFYAANAPNSRLETIVQAIERAIARGVHVRFLAEVSFVREYPGTLDRLQRAGAEIRTLDLSTSTGGILHAKFFIVDDRDAFLGSQNFDWRALEHIQELGARVRDAGIVGELAAVFEMDWERKPVSIRARSSLVMLVASPKDLLPEGVRWDLPALVGMIDAAKTSVRVQLLTYHAGDWLELEQRLVAAAKRGVKVEILLADWSKREKTLGGLLQLAREPNIEIRFVTIPEHSSGFIPFARVIHAKLLVVDRQRAWLGTSNWERDYFYGSRNVGLVIADRGIAARIADFSDATWTSTYATRVDPDAKYTAPRIE